MDLEAIFIYCLCADTFNALNIKDDHQCKMNCAEIATFVIISALHYQCNYRKTRLVMLSHGYFPNVLSHSRIVRRIHQIPSRVWPIIFQICKETLKVKNAQEFIVDSFPVSCCQNNKIFRCKFFKGKEYRGYTASKKTYFFGIKVHMITTVQGIPVEFLSESLGALNVTLEKALLCMLTKLIQTISKKICCKMRVKLLFFRKGKKIVHDKILLMKTFAYL